MLLKYLPIAVVAALLAAVLVVRFVFGGSEDAWICDNGLWVTHGHPAAPMPAEGCGGPISTRLDFASGSPISGIPSRCPEYVNCMPGPDVNRTCIIPPGCENYTQRVY